MSLMLLFLLISTLTGCGGDGDTHQPIVVSHTVSMVFRPGETDGFIAQSDTLDFSTEPTTRYPSTYDLVSNPCGHRPFSYPFCEELQITRTAEAPDAILGKFRYFDTTFTIGFTAHPSIPAEAPEAEHFAIGSGGLSLAVAADGTVWSWGDPYFRPGEWPALPVRVAGLDNIIAVATSGLVSLALRADGTVWAWDIPDFGPVQVPGLDNVIGITGGVPYLVLRADGTVWEFEISGSSPANFSNPVQLSQLSGIAAIDRYGAHAMALDTDGFVWEWDYTSGPIQGLSLYPREPAYVDSNLDDEYQDPVPPPQPLGGIVAIAAGPKYSLALGSNGRVYSWGFNDQDQLGRPSAGNGTFRYRCKRRGVCDKQPETISTQYLDNVTAIAAGGSFGLALRSGGNGAVWAWGDNTYGQLGGPPGLGTLIPQPVNGTAHVLSIAAGRAHAMALSADQACNLGNGRTGGRLLAWGDNQNGQRGDGTAANWLRPTPVLTLGDATPCVNNVGYGERVVIYKSGFGSGTVSSDVPGLICTGMICWQTVAPGTNLTLTATPDAGSTFEDWRWDCVAGTPSTTISVSGTRHCKVRFGLASDAPTASFTMTPSPATVGVAVSYDATASSDDGTITAYDWDFQDDGSFDAQGQSAQFTYSQAGTYTVRLRVTDNDGQTGETTQQLVVNNVSGGNPVLTVVPIGPGSGNVSSSDGTLSCSFAGTSSSPSPCTLVANPGASIRLYAPAAAGSVFSHWGPGDCDATGMIDMTVPYCDITMNSDRSVDLDYEISP